MKMSEKFKIDEAGGRASSGRTSKRVNREADGVARRRLISSKLTRRKFEERFFPMTKKLVLAAVCNRKGFSEWAHTSYLWQKYPFHFS